MIGSHPAHPLFTSLGVSIDVDNLPGGSTTGMTKRVMIAAMALQGLLSRGGISIEGAAGDAVKYADMLITQLNQ